MENKSTGHYSYILQDHHKVPVIIILVCVIVVSFVYSIYLSTKVSWTNNEAFSVTSTNSSKQVDAILTQKQAVIERLQHVDTKPLTHKEAVDIINFVSRGGATYTDAEKEMITKVLRAQ